ncbi:MAG: glycosyltransferase family 4 protein [Candidatus Woesearchaeota archaeon]
MIWKESKKNCKMNICLINPSFFPVRGGGEQLTYDVAKELSNSNKVVIATEQLPNTKPIEIINNIKVYRAKTSKIPFLRLFLNQIYFYKMLLKIIDKEKINLLHMFHLFNLGGAAVLAKRKKKLKLITSLIGWDTYDPIKPVPKYAFPYMAWVMNNSDTVLTSSKHLLKSARKQGARKQIPIISHGTNLHRIKQKTIDIKKKYNIKKDEKIVFSLQRLHKRKGLEYLILAAKKVLANKPNIKFIIGGKGPELNNLKVLAKRLRLEKNIIFAGFIPDEELNNYYQTADLFSLPSLYEGFGIVYVDALINGLPIATTKCGGSEEMVNKSNGILVKPKSSEQLANAILEVLNKTWNKKEIKKNAEKYKWENIIKKYEEIYEKLSFSVSNNPKQHILNPS